MASPTPTEVPSELPHRVRPRGLRRPGRGPGDHPHRPADRAQPHSRLPSTTARPLAAGPPASTNGAILWVNPPPPHSHFAGSARPPAPTHPPPAPSTPIPPRAPP